MFSKELINRLKMPSKHILVVEDNISNQLRIIEHFHKIFEPEGDVQISIVCGGMMAYPILQNTKVDLILLDVNLPYGNGVELIIALRGSMLKTENSNCPIITFSGIQSNNSILMSLGANHEFMKQDVIDGKADILIKDLFGL